jgi:glycerophosphoryl diester phosphodiesterase
MALRSLPLAATLAVLALPSVATAARPGPAGRLEGRAVLPAATFAPGPPSGLRISGPAAGVTVPFASQPVQGFSALLPARDGDLLAMPDNGYGSLENSADFNLRVYRIHPRFATADDAAAGSVKVEGHVQLRDPDHRLPFSIVNEFTRERVLTGADLDIESLQRDPQDGSFWFGDEFGPFLVHTDTTGRVLAAPSALPDPDHRGKDVRAPQSPRSEESTPQRVMNALDARGRARGAAVAPVVSVDANLLDDGDPATAVPDRSAPLTAYDGTSLPAASSEVFNVGRLHQAGFKVVPYTVNDAARMDKLLALGVDGLISDRSDLLYQRVAAFDADKNGTPGDDLLPDGRIDPDKFDAQGHRGSRNLRPENTLPAMEAGLDNLVNTLETDNGITADGVPVLDHEPYVSSVRCRRADGAPYGPADEQLVKELSLAALQARYTCDNVFRGAPQSNDRALSPVAVAFAAQQGLRDPYVMPSTQELFDFADFYADWYTTGPGRDDPRAAVLADNAEQVRFNVETKSNPRTDRDEKGNVYAQRTIGPAAFADKVSGVIEASDEQDRADVQSFDLRTLLRVQDTHPDLPLVALFGDTPKGPLVDQDGTNLQPTPGDGARSAWLAGLQWPYRHTATETPFRAPTSGGFEGMAISSTGRRVLPMLEKPLTGDPAKTLLISEFSLRRKRFTTSRRHYELDPAGVSIGDFQLAEDGRTGLVLERDGGQGTGAAFKAVEEVTLGRGDGHVVTKRPVLDELAIADPAGISQRSPTNQAGDLRLGDPFGLPFVTIEDLQILGPRRLLIANDNNFPFSVGRHVGTGRPDDNELVTVRLDRPIGG